MKKIIASISAIAILMSLLCSCSSSSNWHDEQVSKGAREAQKIYSQSR